MRKVSNLASSRNWGRFFWKLESPVTMVWQVLPAPPGAHSVHYFDISHHELPNELSFVTGNKVFILFIIFFPAAINYQFAFLWLTSCSATHRKRKRAHLKPRLDSLIIFLGKKKCWWLLKIAWLLDFSFNTPELRSPFLLWFLNKQLRLLIHRIPRRPSLFW